MIIKIKTTWISNDVLLKYFKSVIYEGNKYKIMYRGSDYICMNNGNIGVCLRNMVYHHEKGITKFEYNTPKKCYSFVYKRDQMENNI